MPTTIGIQYREGRDVADIAAQIRSDIKRSIDPGVKVGVTIKRYSGGRSLTVLVKQCPFKVWEASCQLTPEAQGVRERIEALIALHKREWESGKPDDSYHTNFFSHVGFATEALLSED